MYRDNKNSQRVYKEIYRLAGTAQYEYFPLALDRRSGMEN